MNTNVTRINSIEELETFLRGPGGVYLVQLSAPVAASIPSRRPGSMQRTGWVVCNRRYTARRESVYAKHMETNKFQRGRVMGFSAWVDKECQWRFAQEDGQHRCGAQMRTGLSQTYCLHLHKTPEAAEIFRKTIDPKWGRSGADLLEISANDPLIGCLARRSTNVSETVNAWLLWLHRGSTRDINRVQEIKLDGLRYSDFVRNNVRALRFVTEHGAGLNAHVRAAYAIAYTAGDAPKRLLLEAYSDCGHGRKAGELLRKAPRWNGQRNRIQKMRNILKFLGLDC